MFGILATLNLIMNSPNMKPNTRARHFCGILATLLLTPLNNPNTSAGSEREIVVKLANLPWQAPGAAALPLIQVLGTASEFRLLP